MLLFWWVLDVWVCTVDIFGCFWCGLLFVVGSFSVGLIWFCCILVGGCFCLLELVICGLVGVLWEWS